jgi:hypothetical protein
MDGVRNDQIFEAFRLGFLLTPTYRGDRRLGMDAARGPPSIESDFASQDRVYGGAGL